jgi:hypothetical protein
MQPACIVILSSFTPGEGSKNDMLTKPNHCSTPTEKLDISILAVWQHLPEIHLINKLTSGLMAT